MRWPTWKYPSPSVVKKCWLLFLSLSFALYTAWFPPKSLTLNTLSVALFLREHHRSRQSEEREGNLGEWVSLRGLSDDDFDDDDFDLVIPNQRAEWREALLDRLSKRGPAGSLPGWLRTQASFPSAESSCLAAAAMLEGVPCLGGSAKGSSSPEGPKTKGKVLFLRLYLFCGQL